MMSKSKFGALAATTSSGKPSLDQIKMNGGMPSSPKGFKSEVHEYDSKRPKRQVVSRYGK